MNFQTDKLTENDVPRRTEWLRFVATYPRTVAVFVVLMLVVCAVIALPSSARAAPTTNGAWTTVNPGKVP